MTKRTKFLSYPKQQPRETIKVRNIDGDNAMDFGTYVFSFGADDVETVLLGGCRSPQSAAADWIRDALRSHRMLSRAPSTLPVIVGLTFFHLNEISGYDVPPEVPDRTCVAAICIAGTQCVVTEVSPKRYSKSRLPSELRTFLMDRRLRFVGIGVKEAADWMGRECKVHISDAQELRPLVEKAFTPKHQPALSPLKPKGAGMQDLARVALGGVEMEDLQLPAADCRWDSYFQSSIKDEVLVNAVKDAYLAWRVGETCFKVLSIN